jgi:hypothetical protein
MRGERLGDAVLVKRHLRLVCSKPSDRTTRA